MSIKEVLKTPFAPLLVSSLFLVLANMVGYVAVSWWIAQQGGAADLARYGVVMSLVSLVAVPLLSPLGDRVAKGPLITAALGCFAVAAMLLAWWVGTRGYRLDVVLAIQAVPMIAMAVVQPATTGLAAELVPASSLQQALNRQQGAQSIGRLAGPALGGAVLAAAGTAPALWLHAALLVMATGLAMRLPRIERADAARRSSWWSELRAGLKANWGIPLERGWMAANFVSWIFIFPALTMLVPLKVQSLQLSAWWLGLCEAMLSLGVLLGALGGANWLIARFGRFNTRVASASAQGLALALAGVTDHPIVLVASFALVGIGSSAMTLVGLTHRTLARPAAYRTRMSAGSIVTTQVAASLGPALAGLALSVWSVKWVYLAFGVLGAAAALSLAAVPGFRAFMALSHEEVDGWYGRAHPEAFGGRAGDAALSASGACPSRSARPGQ
ncbi:MFS transporter [Caldimonas sp. KR1-144]|uniref:MFS transporter n=1 Tax=Caldimonas sp. KR1-144 TaxID=3400911 RepID=UPI003BFAB083